MPLPSDLHTAAQCLEEFDSDFLSAHADLHRPLLAAWEAFDRALAALDDAHDTWSLAERERESPLDDAYERRHAGELDLLSAWDSIEARLGGCEED